MKNLSRPIETAIASKLFFFGKTYIFNSITKRKQDTLGSITGLHL